MRSSHHRGVRTLSVVEGASLIDRRTEFWRRAGDAETILVVEDSADAREGLVIALELHGYRVLQSANGPRPSRFMLVARGRGVVRGDRPRVAVLDTGLPGMDGYELARCVRAEFGRRSSWSR